MASQVEQKGVYESHQTCHSLQALGVNAEILEDTDAGHYKDQLADGEEQCGAEVLLPGGEESGQTQYECHYGPHYEPLLFDPRIVRVIDYSNNYSNHTEESKQS